MKFSGSVIISILAPVAVARVASPDPRDLDYYKRDLATFETVLENVDTGINDLNTAVSAYTGGPGTNVISVANQLVTTINNGKTTIDAQPQLTLSEALALQQPVKTLTSSATTLVDSLTAKRPLFISNTLCTTARGLVGRISTSSNALINSVVAKVPSAAQGIAERLVRDLRAELTRAQTVVNAANCPA